MRRYIVSLVKWLGPVAALMLLISLSFADSLHDAAHDGEPGHFCVLCIAGVDNDDVAGPSVDLSLLPLITALLGLCFGALPRLQTYKSCSPPSRAPPATIPCL